MFLFMWIILHFSPPPSRPFTPFQAVFCAARRLNFLGYMIQAVFLAGFCWVWPEGGSSWECGRGRSWAFLPAPTGLGAKGLCMAVSLVTTGPASGYISYHSLSPFITQGRNGFLVLFVPGSLTSQWFSNPAPSSKVSPLITFSSF